jgi:hypothetical protein
MSGAMSKNLQPDEWRHHWGTGLPKIQLTTPPSLEMLSPTIESLRRMHLMKAILIFCILVAGTASFAQQVTVRLINDKNGRPLVKESVVVQFLDPQSASSPTKLETDSSGEARFVLPSPAPERVNVRVVLKSGHWHCGCWVMEDTKTVVEQGVVESAAARKLADEFGRNPSHIIVIARPLTFGERLLYPFVKH